METFLWTLLKLSVLGCVPAALLLLFRPLLRGRVSRAALYYLWLPVLLRLCIPVGLTIPLPAEQTAPAAPMVSNAPITPTAPAAPFAPSLSGEPGNTGSTITLTGGSTAPAAPAAPSHAAPPAAPSLIELLQSAPLAVLLFALWAAGVLVCLGRYVWGYASFSRMIRRSALPPASEAPALLRAWDPKGRVRLLESSLADTPMVLGAVQPVIILPAGVSDAARLRDILVHELTHIRRRDLLYKWFTAAVTSLHWFNPLMILVRREISRACELSCDEAVLRGMDDAGRRHYGETLLALAAAPDRLPALALCEEKAQLKERLVSIVNYKKCGPAALLLSLLLAVMIAGCATVSGVQPAAPNGGASPDAALLEDATLYEAGDITIAFPNDVYDQLLIFPGEDAVTLVKVYEKASYESAQADFGAEASGGFLFAITRSDQAQYEQFLMSDSAWQSFFARDDTYYYCWEIATDVQICRSGEITEADAQEWARVSSRVQDIKGDFVLRNGLTAYSDSEFFDQEFVYGGEHLYARYANQSLSMTLVLSKPVKQGEDGIWCVERWYDNDTGTGYYSFYLEGHPQDQGITAAEHYQQLQDAADAGARTELLNPRTAAAIWLQNFWGNIDVTQDDVTLLDVDFGQTPPFFTPPAVSDLPTLDAETAAAFAAALEGIYYSQVFPDGTRWEGSNSDQNDFAVYDVDRDGKPELIVRCTAVAMAWQQGLILGYDEAYDTIRTEHAGFPSFRFYDNGTVREGWSHNQTWGDLWPYFILQYAPESDSYVNVGAVSAWNKNHAEQNFPDETDADGDGAVYRLYLTDEDWNNFQQEPEKYVDGAEYARWRDSYLNGAQEIELVYYSLSAENIAALRGDTVPPAEPVAIPEALRTVLQDISPFLYADGTGEAERYEISHVPALFSPDSPYARIDEFAVIDLDGDGEQEVVLRIGDVANDMGGYLILHRANGQVYGFPSPWRTFWYLKTDGTFCYSNYGQEEGIASIRFTETGYVMDKISYGQGTVPYEPDTFIVEGQPVSEEEYRTALDRQDEKPDAVWYEFTDEQIRGG